MIRNKVQLLVLILNPFLFNCHLESKLNHKANSNQGFSTQNKYIEGNLIIEKVFDKFVIPLTLGTPPQSFNVVLDTGSSFIWVSSIYAKIEFSLPNTFNPSTSSTYSSTGKKFMERYKTATFIGVYCEEMVSIVKQSVPITWGLARYTDLHPDSDGILGLGHRYNTSLDYSEDLSLIHQLKKYKLIDHNIFSVKRDEFNDLNSKLFIGGYHEDFNDIAHVASCELIDSSYWKCPLSHMAVSSSSAGIVKGKVIECNVNAIFETGSNKIIAPHWMKKSVEKFLPSNCDFNCNLEEYCFITCSDIQTALDFSMVFGGKSFKLSKRGLYRYHRNQKLFVSNFFFVKNDKKADIIIGMPFFYNMHIAFDNENQKILFHSTNIKNVNEDPLFITSNEGDNLSVIALIVIASALLIGGLLLLVVCLRTKKRDNEYKIDANTVLQYVSNNVLELILS